MTEMIAEPRTHYPAGEEFLLLPPTMQPFAYRNVDKMFATRTIHRGPTCVALLRGPEIAPTYGLDGQTRSVERYMTRTNVAGLLVLKDGAIRLERYALGLDEATRWSSMSMVKSMTSTLVGAAIQDGAIGSLDDQVSSYVTALRGSAYDDVSIRHLLTMSSGVQWTENYAARGSDVNLYSKSLGDKVPGGVLTLMKSLRRAAPPGERFNYNTGDTYVLGCLVSAATGTTLAAYMTQKIWAGFGMEYDGFYTLESEGGQEIGGSRAGMALRDFGRFGLFMLGGGAGVLPSSWTEDANRTSFALDPAQNSYRASGYGYSWWLDKDGAMVAVGFSGQSLYINRARGLVIATLSCWPQPPHDTAYATDFSAERLAFRAAVNALV
ncbi:serine hydrolase [Acidisphaera sp. L21]|uniref:serine hydrolase domain-containing protein n=1 Tax=Acidisphaera sp. L21 TaxID=1641851 RepID=UPI00131B45E2|nr:serine hydrolase [Acidisphaera sp. L21]